jgi:hypothetical protein
MIKLSTFLAESDHGLAAVPIFGSSGAFEKTASAGLLPEVVSYIDTLRPRKDAQYVLVNAMGAGEYFGSNINGDHFPEEALMHRPDHWTGNPLLDKRAAKDWPYGYPTFYNAHAYAHHKNKDPSRAYGEVELAVWNDHMKRVELVVRVDHERCVRFGGVAVWDRLVAGQYPDVSMGTKVPWDMCSICGDWKKYRIALATFNPKKHRHPGIAVLEYHRKHPIRGISITRKDYCQHAAKDMNKILSDGRKVFVYNFFPRFFDISFVFIGADRTAKVMIFIIKAGQAVPSALAAEHLGIKESEVLEPGEKRASVADDILEAAFLKGAEKKHGEIDKKVVPSQFAGKAIPILENSEPGMSEDAMRAMSSVPLSSALATSAGMGMVLKPEEFKNVVLKRALTSATDPLDGNMGSEDFSPALAQSLLPMMMSRSALGPFIERRVVMSEDTKGKKNEKTASLSEELLRKIGGAYDNYRSGVMNLVANTQDLMKSAARKSDAELHKLAAAPVEELITPLSFRYLRDAYTKEASFAFSNQGMVERSSQLPACRGDSPQGTRGQAHHRTDPRSFQ